MSKEQQINQINYLKHQNRQAYLVYCQQIITYLTFLNCLRVIYLANESTIYNEKCTSEAEILSTESHQEIDDVKSLKHKEKPNLKTGLASESLYYQKDEDTGLYYANARYYDSETGRFLREDPFDGDVQTPPSLHRYLYANANPNYYVDPTGKCSTVMDLMDPTFCDRASSSDPEIAKQFQFEQEIEGAAIIGIAEAGVDAVKGTLELAGQISATLGEGLSAGSYYEGSARRFRGTLNSVGNSIAHPIESIQKAHKEHVAKVNSFEQAGDHAAAIQERYRYGTNWAASVLGTAKAIQSLAKSNPKVVVESSDNNIKLEMISDVNQNTIVNAPLTPRFRQGELDRLESVFAKIEQQHIGSGSVTTTKTRLFARTLGDITDDAGHAIGNNLGGSGKVVSNIFPQAPSVNRGAFRQFEQQISRLVNDGKNVFVRVVPKYENSVTTRPIQITYQVRINGVTVTRTFDNPRTN